MTLRRNWRHERRLLAELEEGFLPSARPNILVLLWRWRYELALLTGMPTVIIFLTSQLGYLWTLAEISAVAGTFTVWPQARSWLFAHVRCVITTHRIRKGCEQARIHSRQGKLPIILLTSPQPFGERVHIWCRAGICAEDFQATREILRSACWASDIRVTTNHRYSHIVTLDVIHR